MRNVQLLEEQVANDRIDTVGYKISVIRSHVENVNKRVSANLERIDKLNHKLCETQRRLDVANDQLRALQRFVTGTCGIAAIFMVLICILVGYLLWRTAWL